MSDTEGEKDLGRSEEDVCVALLPAPLGIPPESRRGCLVHNPSTYGSRE